MTIVIVIVGCGVLLQHESRPDLRLMLGLVGREPFVQRLLVGLLELTAEEDLGGRKFPDPPGGATTRRRDEFRHIALGSIGWVEAGREWLGRHLRRLFTAIKRFLSSSCRIANVDTEQKQLEVR